ncbi:putative Pantothenate kinase 3-like protein [Naja naja]|nr:putative Pantothenate kinase 3-like protein [Naja naja]
MGLNLLFPSALKLAPIDTTAEEEQEEVERLKRICKYLTSNATYGSTDIRDVHLELKRLDSLWTEGKFALLSDSQHMTCLLLFKWEEILKKFYATYSGSSAYKSEDFCTIGDLQLRKLDELDCLNKGLLHLSSDTALNGLSVQLAAEFQPKFGFKYEGTHNLVCSLNMFSVKG